MPDGNCQPLVRVPMHQSCQLGLCWQSTLACHTATTQPDRSACPWDALCHKNARHAFTYWEVELTLSDRIVGLGRGRFRTS